MRRSARLPILTRLFDKYAAADAADAAGALSLTRAEFERLWRREQGGEHQPDAGGGGGGARRADGGVGAEGGASARA